MHLVLIETSGNQRYIFASNRLRENVGASELVYRVGTTFVLEAVAAAGGPQFEKLTGRLLRDALLNPQKNVPLQEAVRGVEVIVAASGKAMLLVSDKATGRQIVSEVTRRALEKAPGLDVRGVVSEEFQLSARSLHEVVRDVHRELEALHGCLPTSQQRFLRVPVVDACATSGLPATRLIKVPNENRYEPCSSVSYSKREAAEDGLGRMREAASSYRLPYSADKLENELACRWLAVVHADGNALGQVFVNFDRYVNPGPEAGLAAHNRAYIDSLRRFSLELDACTEKAFCAALGNMHPMRNGAHAKSGGVLPMLPLVLGGDDLTVLCDGEQALPFTRAFLEEFAKQARAGTIQEVFSKGQSNASLTASAGVAIVKPHFPFFAAYDLAEDVLQSAKKLKPFPAIDCHVVFDASGPDLARVRRQLIVDQGATCLTGRPYLVDGGGRHPTHRHVDDLLGWIRHVQARDDQAIPRSVLHDLREALFLGQAEADARYKLVLPRHKELKELAGDRNKPSLFWTPQGGVAPRPARYTGLLDALELAPFWKQDRSDT